MLSNFFRRSQPQVAAEAPHGPELSVVVVVYNIPRQARRTLSSLSAAYQRDIAADDYEVIVVDNGSTPPLDASLFEGLQGNFHLIRIDDASPSPAQAVNRGLAEAKGDLIGVMIDGARMLTPGVLHFARHGAQLYERAVVTTLGWNLGLDNMQRLAQEAGYDEAREQALLASITWPDDGYRLFEIGALDASSVDGWLLPLGESTALFLRRELWDELGGMDERFDLPGGGIVNLDVLERALALPDAHQVVLLGEGSFHQLHGGIASGAAIDGFHADLDRWFAQYESIRGRPFALSGPKQRTLLGTLPKPALLHFLHSALEPVDHRRRGWDAPLGPSFDPALWAIEPPVMPADPAIAAVTALAQAEFRAGHYQAAAAVARLARTRAPDEPEPQRLLAVASCWLPGLVPTPDQQASVSVALGQAYEALGEAPLAKDAFTAALAADKDAVHAHLGLARLRMPGASYYEWLQRFHTELKPETYLEVGVADGLSIAFAEPPTIAIGVDPEPSAVRQLKTETHIFSQASDDFFAQGKLDALLNGKPVSMAFIDGLHTFDQALKDFFNIEACSGPQSMVVFHDTVPLDEVTQERERKTTFWTGDVWKVVLCLKHYRPDLDIFTIATAPTGLTVVLGLDPASRVLADAYDEAIARFMDVPFCDVKDSLFETMNVLPNDWDTIAERLRAHGILKPA